MGAGQKYKRRRTGHGLAALHDERLLKLFEQVVVRPDHFAVSAVDQERVVADTDPFKTARGASSW